MLSLEKPSADLPNVVRASLQTSARTARWRHGTQQRAITQADQLGNIRVRQTDLVCPCCATSSHAFPWPWKVSLLRSLSQPLPIFCPCLEHLYFPVFPISPRPTCLPSYDQGRAPRSMSAPQSSYERRSWLWCS